VAAQLVAFPAGAVASEYVGTGAAGYVTAALTGLASAAAARAAGGARWSVTVVAVGYALLAVGLGDRLVPGGIDPLPTTGATAASYAVAGLAALLWMTPARGGLTARARRSGRR
jgi:hypothetical protein